MGVNHERDWTQDAALRNPSDKDDGGGCGSAHPDLWGLFVTKSLIHRQRGDSKLQHLQFVARSAGTEVNKQHRDDVFQVVEGRLEGDGDAIACGFVTPVGNLMLVQVSWDVGFNVLQHRSLHATVRGHRSVIIQPCDGRGLGHADYGGSF